MYTSKQLQSVTFCYILVHTTTCIQLHAYNYLQLLACNYITLHAFTLPCLTLHAYAPLSQHIYLMHPVSFKWDVLTLSQHAPFVAL